MPVPKVGGVSESPDTSQATPSQSITRSRSRSGWRFTVPTTILKATVASYFLTQQAEAAGLDESGKSVVAAFSAVVGAMFLITVASVVGTFLVFRREANQLRRDVEALQTNINHRMSHVEETAHALDEQLAHHSEIVAEIDDKAGEVSTILNEKLHVAVHEIERVVADSRVSLQQTDSDHGSQQVVYFNTVPSRSNSMAHREARRDSRTESGYVMVNGGKPVFFPRNRNDSTNSATSEPAYPIARNSALLDIPLEEIGPEQAAINDKVASQIYERPRPPLPNSDPPKDSTPL